MKKIHLDKLMVAKQLATTRQKAQAAIVAGIVEVNGLPANKPGSQFPENCNITIKGPKNPFVSRGGLKLAAGLEFFKISPAGYICADIGASTGGFTDCLLQNGARKVYAVDVGYGQLDWKLRQDDRVIVMERTNARNLTPADIPDPLDLAVIDASFISLKLLLPAVLPMLGISGLTLALIKPQFEAVKDQVGKGGVVRDSQVHETVIADILAFAESLSLNNHGVTASPIFGPKGNKEFLVCFSKK
ncbi:MAG: TlyA family RNA methyltransferase [Proteobacteria bacterium]|nr:TlyA family RNA methyltransferase [Pseudomonadota bacterium]MBU1711067.1 TlyA family RNA methyltransferase [Pseudomonadota bacterium]